MNRVLLSLITGLLLATGANALPPRQHFIDGTLASIDREKIALGAPLGKMDAPTVFVFEEGRTRFRESGKKRSVEQLKVGEMIRIYYKRENGVWVATGVSWKPPASAVTQHAGCRLGSLCALRIDQNHATPSIITTGHFIGPPPLCERIS